MKKSLVLSLLCLAGIASAADLVRNGSFESSPLATTLTIADSPVVDTTTFTDWRFFSVGTTPIKRFIGTIVDAGSYKGGNSGSHAMRLDTDNTGSPAGFDYGLDNNEGKFSVAQGIHYTLSFDLELDGITGGAMAFEASIAEFDAAGVYTGSQTDFNPSLPTDQTFHHYSKDYVVQNPNTTQVVIGFRPRNPGFVSAVVLDNVQFGIPAPGAVQPATLRPVFAVTGTVGAHYRIEYATTSAPNVWLLLQDIPQLPSSPFTVCDPKATTLSDRSYRAVLSP